MAFTDAAAGNLALHVGDDPVEVRHRRAGIEAALGLGGRPFRYMNQVHGNEVAGIGAAAAPGSGADATLTPTDAPTADAMVSLGEPLAVMVADCVPVVLVGDRAGAKPRSSPSSMPGAPASRPASSRRPWRACANSARPGSAPGSARPSADGCYEVPEDMRDDVAARVPAAWCTTSRGTPGLDLPAAVRSQLQDAA